MAQKSPSDFLLSVFFYARSPQKRDSNLLRMKDNLLLYRIARSVRCGIGFIVGLFGNVYVNLNYLIFS